MGAILVNVVRTELAILSVYLFCLPIISNNIQLVLTILFVVALAFPVTFYHHSWSVWLSFDHLVETLPKRPGTAGVPPAQRVRHNPER